MFKARRDRRYTEVGGCLLNFHSDSTNKLRTGGGDTGRASNRNKRSKAKGRGGEEKGDRTVASVRGALKEGTGPRFAPRASMNRYFVVYAYKFCSVELKRRQPGHVAFNRP